MKLCCLVREEGPQVLLLVENLVDSSGFQGLKQKRAKLQGLLFCEVVWFKGFVWNFLKLPIKTHFMDVIEIASHKLGEITIYHSKLYTLITLYILEWKDQKPPLPNQLKTKPLSLSHSSPLLRSKSSLAPPLLHHHDTTSPPLLHHCSTINPPLPKLMFCNSSVLWVIDIGARRANWCHWRFCHMKTKVVFGSL